MERVRALFASRSDRETLICVSRKIGSRMERVRALFASRNDRETSIQPCHRATFAKCCAVARSNRRSA
eukprot:11206550-Lingulodinium_polyedra.AAC.1